MSINRPFKDILKEKIDEKLDALDEGDFDLIGSKLEVGRRRIFMTHCVAEAWIEFCSKSREIVIQSFCQCGISLPINGGCDGEIKIKGLETVDLMVEVGKWDENAINDILDAVEDNNESVDSDLESDSSDFVYGGNLDSHGNRQALNQAFEKNDCFHDINSTTELDLVDPDTSNSESESCSSSDNMAFSIHGSDDESLQTRATKLNNLQISQHLRDGKRGPGRPRGSGKSRVPRAGKSRG